MFPNELGGCVPDTGRAIDRKRFNIRVSLRSERCNCATRVAVHRGERDGNPDPTQRAPFPRTVRLGATFIVTTRGEDSEGVFFRIVEWCKCKYQVKRWTLGRRLSFGGRPDLLREANGVQRRERQGIFLSSFAQARYYREAGKCAAVSYKSAVRATHGCAADSFAAEVDRSGSFTERLQFRRPALAADRARGHLLQTDQGDALCCWRSS